MLPRTVLRAELVEYIESLGRLVLELKENALRREGELTERAAALARSEGMLAERQRELEAAFRELERQRLELAELAQRLQFEQAALETQREVLRQKEEVLAARQALLEQQEELVRFRRERGFTGRQQGGAGPSLRISATPLLSGAAQLSPVREAGSGEGARELVQGSETESADPVQPEPVSPATPASGRDGDEPGADVSVVARIISPMGEVRTVQPTVRWGVGEGQAP